jgi:hypothetical protein
MKKAYSFVNDNDTIITPDESSYESGKSGSSSSGPQIKSELDHAIRTIYE